MNRSGWIPLGLKFNGRLEDFMVPGTWSLRLTVHATNGEYYPLGTLKMNAFILNGLIALGTLKMNAFILNGLKA